MRERTTATLLIAIFLVSMLSVASVAATTGITFYGEGELWTVADNIELGKGTEYYVTIYGDILGSISVEAIDDPDGGHLSFWVKSVNSWSPMTDPPEDFYAEGSGEITSVELTSTGLGPVWLCKGVAEVDISWHPDPYYQEQIDAGLLIEEEFEVRYRLDYDIIGLHMPTQALYNFLKFSIGPPTETFIETFIPPLEATVDINPDTLNLKSRGRWITAFITLPEGYSVGDIDPDSVYLGEIESAWSKIQDEVFMVKFDRAELIECLGTPEDKFSEATLEVTGILTDGTPFEGSDTIKVIKKG